ncbi:MAG: transketolase, partial [Deltaproteobacteria bacterium]|nr:transketolase [Deltaproteobacteria bacterium]
MAECFLVTRSEFDRIKNAKMRETVRLFLLSDMCRLNTLTAVKLAGSGHLGSSFSSLDMVTFLYYSEMNTARVGVDHPDRDIYFSSKGHDVPGLYAVLHAIGILPSDQLLNLRRLRGTCGHPHVNTPGVEANSGSLGMGISKAKGMAIAKKLRERVGRVFVMTGDGEFQEGQIYEALQGAAHQGVSNLTVILDHNKVQSDRPVEKILHLGNLEEKLRAFGWHVARCDGHNFEQIARVFQELKGITDKPKILIADTIKGKGVSFMEHPQALQEGGGLYKWHAGAPDDPSFENGYQEILDVVNARLARE